jgi:hypothetical protein
LVLGLVAIEDPAIDPGPIAKNSPNYLMKDAIRKKNTAVVKHPSQRG